MSPTRDRQAHDAADVDRLFSVVSSAQRRGVIDYFRTSSDSTASLETLVDHIVSDEKQTKAERRKRVATHLHHSALPKLTSAGVVEYDAQSGTVRYRGRTRVEDLVDYATRLEANDS
ncbi:DUF7344 domain-containing protein [Halorussus halophilus]